MALLIYVLRYYLYIPLLIAMGKKTISNQGLTEEIQRYWDKVVPQVDFPCKSKEEILEFVEWLSEMNQTPKDWGGNYYDKIDYSGEEHTFLSQDELYKRKLQYINKQNQLVEAYLNVKKMYK